MAGGPSRNQFIQLLNVSGFPLVPSPTPNRWPWILLFNLIVHSYFAGIPSSLDASLHSNSNYLSNDIVIHRDNQRCRIDQTRTSSGDMESSRLETPHPIDGPRSRPWTAAWWACTQHSPIKHESADPIRGHNQVPVQWTLSDTFNISPDTIDCLLSSYIWSNGTGLLLGNCPTMSKYQYLFGRPDQNLWRCQWSRQFSPIYPTSLIQLISTHDQSGSCCCLQLCTNRQLHLHHNNNGNSIEHLSWL